MSIRRALRGSAVAATAAAALWSGAAHAEGPRQTFSAAFSTTAPGQAAGVVLDIDYVNPSDPDAKPPAVEEVVIHVPPGARVDTAAIPRCDAPDPLIVVLGTSACPQGSVLGRGELTLHTGLVLSEDDVTLVNAAEQLIFITRPKELPIPGGLVTRSAVEDGTRFRTALPPVPGLPPPDAFTALDRVHLVVDRRSGPGGAYLTTPPSCPAEGYWTIEATFRYRDGATQPAAATSPCEPVAAHVQDAGAATR